MLHYQIVRPEVIEEQHVRRLVRYHRGGQLTESLIGNRGSIAEEKITIFLDGRGKECLVYFFHARIFPFRMLGLIVDYERLQIRKCHVRAFLLISDKRRYLENAHVQPVRIQLYGLLQCFLCLTEQLVVESVFLEIVHVISGTVLQREHRIFPEKPFLVLFDYRCCPGLVHIIRELAYKHLRIIRISGSPPVEQRLDSHA